MRLIPVIVTALIITIGQPKLHALILYSGDNAANTTDPGNGVPWDNVGVMYSSDPLVNSSASVISIRGKYLLTANHAVVRSRITFDGEAEYPVDLDFTPIKIGTTDLKILKLQEDPELDPLVLNTNTLFDRLALTTTYIVAYGRGRDTSIEDQGSGTTTLWAQGGLDTVAKRWGTNAMLSASSNPISDGTNTYYALISDASSLVGDNEAKMVDRDSGSAVFQRINNQWVLSGVTTAQFATNSGFATFDPQGSDKNYYVRVSFHDDEIAAALPDLSTYEGYALDYSLHVVGEDSGNDPDGDGMSNFLEFAFGTDPREADAHLGPALTHNGGEVILRWQQNEAAAGLSFIVEETASLVNENFANSAAVVEELSNDGSTSAWQARRTLGDESISLRLQVDSQ